MAKVFDVVTVDGTQVVVTHFLATFTDLPSWLEENSASPDPSESKTVLMEPPQLPTPAPAPRRSAARRIHVGVRCAHDARSRRDAPRHLTPRLRREPTGAAGGQGFVHRDLCRPEAGRTRLPPASSRGKRATPRKSSPRVTPPARASGVTAGSRATGGANLPVVAPPGSMHRSADFTRVFQASDPSQFVVPPAAIAAPAHQPPSRRRCRRASARSATGVAGCAKGTTGRPAASRAATIGCVVYVGVRRKAGAKHGCSAARISRGAGGAAGWSAADAERCALRLGDAARRVAPPRPAPAPPAKPAKSAMNSTSEDFNALFARLDPAASAQPPAPPAYAPPSTSPSGPPAPNLGGPPSARRWRRLHQRRRR